MGKFDSKMFCQGPYSCMVVKRRQRDIDVDIESPRLEAIEAAQIKLVGSVENFT